jgi:hypothetical protein
VCSSSSNSQGREKKKKKSQGRAKNMGRKTEDRVSPNRKTAKKQGKKNALKKKLLRLSRTTRKISL